MRSVVEVFLQQLAVGAYEAVQDECGE